MLATVPELGARLSEDITTNDELMRAEAALVDASALVLDVGDPEWTEATVPARARQIVLAVAQRVWRNPDGLSQASVGDVSVSYARAGDGGVYLTKAEERSIRRVAQTSFRAATYADPYPPRNTYWYSTT